jgi:hypothetical protein
VKVASRVASMADQKVARTVSKWAQKMVAPMAVQTDCVRAGQMAGTMDSRSAV